MNHNCEGISDYDDCPGCVSDLMEMRALQEKQRQPPPEFKPDVHTMLLNVWAAYTQGKGAIPRIRLDVGSAIYEEFERSLVVFERFVDREEEPVVPRHLAFKAGRMCLDPNARNPYSIRIGEQRED